MTFLLFTIVLIIYLILFFIHGIKEDEIEDNHIKSLLFYYTSKVVKPILKIFELLYIKLKWNKGICSKCKSDRYEMVDFDSDRLKPYYYKCKKCSHLLKTHNAYDELNDSETKSKIREEKLKNIGL